MKGGGFLTLAKGALDAAFAKTERLLEGKTLRDRLFEAFLELSKARKRKPIQIGPGRRTLPKGYGLKELSRRTRWVDGGPGGQKQPQLVRTCMVLPKRKPKLMPHQGEREKARRLSQMKHHFAGAPLWHSGQNITS